jgi:hypothetical protein
MALTLLVTVWATDFKTPVGSSTCLSFILFLGQHQQKKTKKYLQAGVSKSTERNKNQFQQSTITQI